MVSTPQPNPLRKAILTNAQVRHLTCLMKAMLGDSFMSNRLRASAILPARAAALTEKTAGLPSTTDRAGSPELPVDP